MQRRAKRDGPALLLVPWLHLLDAEDDALGDLRHLPLAVLDCQFGAEASTSQIVDRIDAVVPPEDYMRCMVGIRGEGVRTAAVITVQ